MTALRLTAAAEAFLRAQPGPVELTVRGLELAAAFEALPDNLRFEWHRELLAAAEEFRAKRVEAGPGPLSTYRKRQHLRLVISTR